MVKISKNFSRNGQNTYTIWVEIQDDLLYIISDLRTGVPNCVCFRNFNYAKH